MDTFCVTFFQQMIFCKLFIQEGTQRGVGRGKVHLECNVYFSEEYYLSCGYTSKKDDNWQMVFPKHHQASQSRCRIMTYYKEIINIFWTHLETSASLYSLDSKMPRCVKNMQNNLYAIHFSGPALNLILVF